MKIPIALSILLPSILAMAACGGEAPQIAEDGQAGVDIDPLTREVHELGVEARDATDLNAQAQVYGKFLATCASCHQRLGQGPG